MAQNGATTCNKTKKHVIQLCFGKVFKTAGAKQVSCWFNDFEPCPCSVPSEAARSPTSIACVRGALGLGGGPLRPHHATLHQAVWPQGRHTQIHSHLSVGPRLGRTLTPIPGPNPRCLPPLCQRKSASTHLGSHGLGQGQVCSCKRACPRGWRACANCSVKGSCTPNLPKNCCSDSYPCDWLECALQLVEVQEKCRPRDGERARCASGLRLSLMFDNTRLSDDDPGIWPLLGTWSVQANSPFCLAQLCQLSYWSWASIVLLGDHHK